MARARRQADHTLPVAEGGGCCGIGNFRTLCVPCHRQETEALRRRLEERKRKAAAAGTADIRQMLGARAPKLLAGARTDGSCGTAGASAQADSSAHDKADRVHCCLGIEPGVAPRSARHAGGRVVIDLVDVDVDDASEGV